jgi:hypothetical protein
LLLALRFVLYLVSLGGPHLVSVSSLVVGSGFGLALVVYIGPLTPFEPSFSGKKTKNLRSRVFFLTLGVCSVIIDHHG